MRSIWRETDCKFYILSKNPLREKRGNDVETLDIFPFNYNDTILFTLKQYSNKFNRIAIDPWKCDNLIPSYEWFYGDIYYIFIYN